jgi:hypothetical protein
MKPVCFPLLDFLGHKNAFFDFLPVFQIWSIIQKFFNSNIISGVFWYGESEFEVKNAKFEND